MGTTPTPKAGSAPKTASQTRADNAAGDALGNLVIAPAGGGSSSLYGLGAVAGKPVNVGGLFPVLSKNGQPTAEEVVAQFAKSNDPTTIAQIQHQLLLGGFYGKDTTPNFGVVNPDDIKAFADATTTAAQTGADMGDYLNRQARFGQNSGIAAAIAGQAGKARQITVEDPLTLSALIEKEYQSLTGKKPDASEKAGFIAAFNAAYRTAQDDNYNRAQAGATDTPQGGFYSDPNNLSTAPTGAQPDPGSPGNLRIFEENAAGQGNPGYDLSQPPPIDPATAQGGQVEQQNFDPSAFAEEYVRQHAGTATDAHDVTGQFSTLLQLLGGIGG